MRVLDGNSGAKRSFFYSCQPTLLRQMLDVVNMGIALAMVEVAPVVVEERLSSNEY